MFSSPITRPSGHLDDHPKDHPYEYMTLTGSVTPHQFYHTTLTISSSSSIGSHYVQPRKDISRHLSRRVYVRS